MPRLSFTEYSDIKENFHNLPNVFTDAYFNHESIQK